MTSKNYTTLPDLRTGGFDVHVNQLRENVNKELDNI